LIVSTTTSAKPSASTTAAATTTSAVVTSAVPKEAQWWDKFGEPKYGGTITVVNPGILTISFDNYSLIGSGDQWWLESLFSQNVWTLDRSEWNYAAGFIPPQYCSGCLVDTWEQTDPQTVVLHLRQGIHFQNKAPVNGREFTAYDVQAHYNRVLGTGDGYTTKSPTYMGASPNWEKVVAVDKYTAKLTFTRPTGILGVMSVMAEMSMNTIEAPEWVALKKTVTTGGNPLEDWHNAVGTGAWILTDYVSNSSLTYSKNPDYWGYDERYPKNKLPYADTIKKLLIADDTTKLAALRTGKLDRWDNVTQINYKAATESNSEIKYLQNTPPVFGVTFRVDKVPFTDIRVRKAMQMALDNETIAKSNGVNYLPCGLVSIAMKGFNYAYAAWPQSLKDEYSYNITEARKLLTEAGYPNGFNTNVVIGPNAGIANYEVLKAYFTQIGINMEIKVIDDATLRAYTATGKHDQLAYGQANMGGSPTNVLSRYDGNNTSLNLSRVNDPTYQSLLGQLAAATNINDLAELVSKCDKLTVEGHWNTISPGVPQYNMWSSRLKGFSGVEGTMYAQGGWLFARLWIAN